MPHIIANYKMNDFIYCMLYNLLHILFTTNAIKDNRHIIWNCIYNYIFLFL